MKKMDASCPSEQATVSYPRSDQEHVEGGGCESEGMDEGLGTNTCTNTI